MIFQLLDRLCGKIDQLGWRGSLRKTPLYPLYKWLRATPMFFDYRMVNLYSRKAFRDMLDDTRAQYEISLWLKSFQHLSEDLSWVLELEQPLPWTNFRVIWYMNFFLANKEAPSVFEYGAGASTLWFSRHAAKVVSVEHDKQWFDRLRQALSERQITNVECSYIPPKQLQEGKENRFSSHFYPGMSFEDYTLSLTKQEDSFDLVFIDGVSRQAALVLANTCVKDGGIIVLDNSERERYSQAIKDLCASGWRAIQTSGPLSYGDGMGETTIFVRKSDQKTRIPDFS